MPGCVCYPGVPEAAHRPCPLKPDDGPFEPGQKVEGQSHTANCKNGEQHQRFGPPRDKHDMQQRRHQMPDQQDRKIGRSVISPRVRVVKLAHGAGVGQFQVAFQQSALAASGAFALPSSHQRGAHGPFGFVRVHCLLGLHGICLFKIVWTNMGLSHPERNVAICPCVAMSRSGQSSLQRKIFFDGKLEPHRLRLHRTAGSTGRT